MRVIPDVVINHSDDNWSYPGDFPYYYSNDQRFDFGAWRRADRPIPNDLRDTEGYHRNGLDHAIRVRSVPGTAARRHQLAEGLLQTTMTRSGRR